MPTPGCQAGYVLHPAGSSTHTLTATQTKALYDVTTIVFRTCWEFGPFLYQQGNLIHKRIATLKETGEKVWA